MRSYLEKVKEYVGIRPQYDSNSCQSACCASVTGVENVRQVRAELSQIGYRLGQDAGSCQVMGEWLTKRLGDRYELDIDASLNDCKAWLKAGEVLITHGFWTGFGHVTVLSGLEEDEKSLSYRFITGDPWGEIDTASWYYNKPAKWYEGPISSRAVYAACVYGQSVNDAYRCFKRGELDSARCGMWVHRIKP